MNRINLYENGNEHLLEVEDYVCFVLKENNISKVPKSYIKDNNLVFSKYRHIDSELCFVLNDITVLSIRFNGDEAILKHFYKNVTHDNIIDYKQTESVFKLEQLKNSQLLESIMIKDYEPNKCTSCKYINTKVYPMTIKRICGLYNKGVSKSNCCSDYIKKER